MASVPGAISAQPAAEALQGQEALPLDQSIGNPVAATAMVVGNAYRIVTLGNTNWQTAGAPAGAVVGTLFKCEATGAGTGTAQRVDTRQAALSALASFVLGSNANLSALASLAGQTTYGRAFLALLNDAAARDYIGIGPDDSLTLTGLNVTGLATLSHIHGNLAGGLYAHVRNVSGSAIAAGTPLRVTGTVGNTTTLQVVPADASSAGTMPALVIASEALTATGAGTDGHATMTGEIGGLDTGGLTPGAPLYVRSGGGIFTATRPAANAQQVATVGRVHGNTGSIHVLPWPVLGTAAAAAVADFAAAGAPAAAVVAHEGAADPHPQYLTPAEGNAAYATAAQGVLASTAVQPAALTTALAGKVDTTDNRLSDAREWSAETATQAEAEAGTGTSRRAFTPQRVFQAIAAWWQSVSTVTGRAVVGAVDPAAARSAIGAGTSSVALSANPAQGLGATAAAGSSGQAADAAHIHQRDTSIFVMPLTGNSDPVGSPTTLINRAVLPVGGTFLGVALDCETAISGAAFIVNITLNGTTIFSTKPQINVGGNATGNTPVLSITTFAPGDVLRAYIDQASGGGRFANITFTVRRSS